MEPEDVVHVLRRLLRCLVPGGRVVDLSSVPPDGIVHTGGETLGRLDESAFFPRALASAAALDDLVALGMLSADGEERLAFVVDYPAGADAVADVEKRSYGRMPPELAARVSTIAGPVRITEHALVRSFTLLGAVRQK